MEVSVKFKTHTSNNRSCGEIEIRENGLFEYRVSFEHRDWIKFRKGAGRGSKPNQLDYIAFTQFLKDQGPQQLLDRPEIIKFY